MGDKPFRVLLDLTDLHTENFKYVWINVSPRELKTISDFKTALLHKLSLGREDIKLFVRDGLLLEKETIIVLREDDTVKVKYEEHFQSFSIVNSGRETEKFSRKRNPSECNSDMPSNKKRCKTDREVASKSNDSNSIEVNNNKKKTHRKSINLVSSDEVVDYSETLEGNDNNKEKCQKKKKRKSALLESNTSECSLNQNYDSFFDVTNITGEINESSLSVNVIPDNLIFGPTKDDSSKTNGVAHEHEKEADINEILKGNTDVKKAEGVNNCPKKKRRRHRKRKQSESTVTNISHNTESNTKFISFSDTFEDKRKHVLYSSGTCEKDSAVVCIDANKVEKSPRDTFIVSNNISTVNSESFKDYPKISTPTLSDGCGNPSWQVSLMQNRNPLYNSESLTHKKEHLREAGNDKSVAKKSISIQNFEENKFPPEMQYEDLPDLNAIPEIGACIVYKTLELDESYSPTMSEYRKGIVRSINPDSEEIEIELVIPIIQPGRTGKFENLKEEEIPYPEVKTSDVLRWCNIISPKQLF